MSKNLGTLTLDMLINLTGFKRGMKDAENTTKNTTDKMSDNLDDLSKNAEKAFNFFRESANNALSKNAEKALKNTTDKMSDNLDDLSKNAEKAFNSFRESANNALSNTQFGSWARDLQDKFNGVNGSAAALGGTLAGLAAGGAVLAFGAMSKLAIETANANMELQKFANLANSSVITFQGLAGASELMGISQDKLADQLKDFNEKLGEFASIGSGGAMDFFEQIAVKTEKGADGAKKLAIEMSKMSGVEALQKYVDKLEEAGVNQQQMSFYLESMASDLTALIPILTDGGKLWKEYQVALEEAGVITSEEAIKKSALLQAQTKSLQLQYGALKSTLAEQMMPVLSNTISYFTSGTNQGQKFTGILTGLTAVAKGVAIVMVGLSATIEAVVRGIRLAVENFTEIGITAKNVFDAVADGNLDGVTSALANGFNNLKNNTASWGDDIYRTANKALTAMGDTLSDNIAKADKLGKSILDMSQASQNAVKYGQKGLTDGVNQNKALNEDDKKAKSSKNDKNKPDYQIMVYKAFRNNGLSDAQARAFTAEVGRENGYDTRYLFGGHIDASNKKQNLGMISWQGSRRDNLIQYLNRAGVIKNGKIEHTQEALNAQVAFALQEIVSNSAYAQTKNKFLANPDVDYKTAYEVLGDNFIRWDRSGRAVLGQAGARKHAQRRDEYYRQISAKLSASGDNSIIKEIQNEEKEDRDKKIAERDKAQLEIKKYYMSELEKAYHEHQERLKNIAEQFKPIGNEDNQTLQELALLQQRYTEEENRRYKEITDKLTAEQNKLKVEQEKKMLEYRQLWIDANRHLFTEEEIVNLEYVIKLKEVDLLEENEDYKDVKKQIALNKRNQRLQDYHNQKDIENNAQRENIWGQYQERFGESENPYLRDVQLLKYARQQMLITEQQFHLQQQKLQITHYAQMGQAMTGSLMSMIDESSTAYTALFAIQKGFAVAQSIVAIQTALAEAMKLPFPANLGAYATVFAQTANIVSTIRGTTLQGMAHNGMTNIPKEGTWLLDGGERVLNPKQNQDLTRYLQERKQEPQQNNNAVQNNIKIVNNFDENMLVDAMNSRRGEQVILNVIKRNKSSLGF